MLPFNIVSELAHVGTGCPLVCNIMKGDESAIPANHHPLLFPIALSALGLLTGMVQADIFSILQRFTLQRHDHARPRQTPSPTRQLELRKELPWIA
ncbi:hypothetical protein ACVBEG_27615 [Pseudomonas sp. GG8]